MKIENVRGFTLAYNNKDGSIGFLGIDDHSGGYPYFNDEPDNRNIKSSPAKVTEQFRTFKNMKTYYGNYKVDFDSARVVKMTVIFDDVEVNSYEEDVMDEIMSNLTDEEKRILRKNRDTI